ncbi:MAG: enoyl-CoA hydratase/isomerase family protein [SAR324 cluster bacterium]|nr:enoyl-CoA hydratase/isomerase family protein [SAR324 cluster bacterium]
MSYEFETISVEIDRGVLFATLSNPPINVMTPPLYNDLVGFTAEVEVDTEVRVVVMQSADPDFFIAHFDAEILLAMPIDEPAQREPEVNDFHKMCEPMRTMPKATIAKIAGRVGGGGSEFAASCDMRFGVLEKTRINQMKVALGILPGGTDTQ